ncbi:MAG: transcription termination factor NusA [Kiritimatiellia bacterium]
MNTELQSILAYIERERGIDREVLIQAVEYALQSASRKVAGLSEDARIVVDRETLEIRAFASLTVVEKSRPARSEISLSKARQVKPDAGPGDVVEAEVTPRNFGRIAAQTAKQAILQKIKQAEKDIVFEEYKDRGGELVSGAVRQFVRNDIIVDLGRAEAVIPSRERVPTEEYQIGDRIRALILRVEPGLSGPGIILSRSSADFVRVLFKLEVAEISDKVVEIKGIAREPGYRTKIAVISHDEKVDPVGACVGMRGIRVKNIVRELSGEKIDIVRWSDDIKTCAANALSPAKLAKVTVDEENKVIHIIADQEQLSLAIGKRGQNVRLTSKLLDWKIEVEREESGISFEEKVARAVGDLADVDGISRENAEALVKAGFLTIEGILAAEPEVLEEMAGLDSETASAVHEAAAATQTEKEGA